MGERARRLIPKWGDATRAPSPGRSDIDFGTTKVVPGACSAGRAGIAPGLYLQLVAGQNIELEFASLAKLVSFLGQFEICLRLFPRLKSQMPTQKGMNRHATV